LTIPPAGPAIGGARFHPFARIERFYIRPLPRGFKQSFGDLIGRIAGAQQMCLSQTLIANTPTNTETTPQATSHIEIEGKIVAVLPGTMFRVQLANGHVVLAHISGKLRKHFIKIAAGDMVKMEMSPYDTEKARITYRMKDTNSSYRPPARRRR
jgi:translation initiation factor IF-1